MLLSRSFARIGWIQCRGLSRSQSIDRAVAYYNDLIGITECESALSDAQQHRRQKQFELRKLQTRLKDIHGELDRTPRGSDRYLHLVTEEHGAIKQEQKLMDEFEQFEDRKREAFHQLLE
ncbi:hypothetical protein M3Y94_00939400 [Aphelenchoides besseyi]|nr:hypothetical protein M3Y94_00939400 [Aphelenchoides besseyi]